MLRSYQIQIRDKGVEILQNWKILYLAMQVRTGKTLTALAVADKIQAKSVLFVTKKKAISGVEKDFKEMGPVHGIHPSFRLEVVNYEMIHKVNPDGYDLIILDEAHCLGQYPLMAERTLLLKGGVRWVEKKKKVVKGICENKPVIMLSGTPSPESFSQLFHQFHVSSFSPWREYDNFYKWAKDYVVVKKKYMYNREHNDYSGAIPDKVLKDVEHLMISYTQQEAGFSQEVKEMVLWLDMKKGTMMLMDRLIRDRVYIAKDGSGEIVADTEVKLMNKLHQLSSGTIILGEEGVSGVRAVYFDKTKAEFIRDRFAGQKIAVYYMYRAEGEMLREVFRGRITEDADEFNRRSDLVYISQVKSGREGVNLSTAEVLVMLNIDYSAVSYWQARARMQTKDRVMEAWLCWIFSRGGIEENIYRKVLSKKDYTLRHFRRDYGLVKERKMVKANQ